MIDALQLPAAPGTKLAFQEVVINGVTFLVAMNKIGHGEDGAFQEVNEANPLPVKQSDVATAVKQDEAKAAIEALAGSDYERIGANAADVTLGGAGAAGDFLGGLVIVPASKSPGSVSIKDGDDPALSVFAGGADSISTLHPIQIGFGIVSTNGAWSVTTGADVSVFAIGRFT